MAFNWSKRFSTSRHQRKNRFRNNSGRKDTIKMLKVFKKIHLPWVDQVSEPFAFSNGFFFKLHKNTAVLSLSQIERGWYFQKLIFLSLCLISEGRNIGLKSGQKREIQGLFWHFFLGFLWGPRSVTSRNFASSRVEWAGGERLGTRLLFKQKISTPCRLVVYCKVVSKYQTGVCRRAGTTYIDTRLFTYLDDVVSQWHGIL